MTTEDKELLLKDISARLPYDCKVTIAEGGIDGLQWNNVTLNSYLLCQIEEEDSWEYIKPYLRPMSSMTEEEDEEFKQILEIELDYIASNEEGHTVKSAASSTFAIDFYNRHHFDYRGLIERGLAIEVTESNNPYKE